MVPFILMSGHLVSALGAKKQQAMTKPSLPQDQLQEAGSDHIP